MIDLEKTTFISDYFLLFNPLRLEIRIILAGMNELNLDIS